MADILRLWLRRYYRWLAKHRPSVQLDKVGSDYGGWFLPLDLIRADWVCYAGGVGEDVTFALGIIDRFGCQVFAFDPHPRAIAYVADHANAVKQLHSHSEETKSELQHPI